MMKKMWQVLFSFFVIIGLTGCGQQEIIKEYPFSLSSQAIYCEYPTNNIFGLNSIINDFDQEQEIIVLEFLKHPNNEYAGTFIQRAKAAKEIKVCNNYVSIGVTNMRFFENDDAIYFYITFDKTKEVSEIEIYCSEETYWIELLDQLRLIRTEYSVNVENKNGLLITIQEFDSEVNSWSEIETEFTPVEFDIL